jgi:hypothetical protein
VIADLRRSAASWELWIALVFTFIVAVLGVVAGWALLGIVGGGFVALALAYLMIRLTWLIPVLVILGFALEPALKFYISDGLGPAKDAAVVIAIAAIIASFLRRRWGLNISAASYPKPDLLLVVGVLAFLALYAINPGGDHGSEWATGARLVVEAFSLLLVGYLGFAPVRTWRWVVVAVLVMAAIETFAGIAQQFIGVDRLVHNFGYLYGEQVRQVAGGALRSFGTLDEPFSYAALVLLGLIVALHARVPRAVKVPLAVILAVGVVVSFDRTDIVLMILAAALWMARRRLAAPAIGVLVAAALVGAAYIGTNDAQPAAQGSSAASTLLSLNGRIDSWESVLADPGNFLGGAGVGVTGAGAASSQVNGIVATGHSQIGVAPPPALPSGALSTLGTLDSSYLATLSDVGLVGLLLLLLIAARMIILAAGACRTGSSAGWVAAGTVGLLLLDATTRSSLTAFPFGFIGLYVFGASLAAAQAEVAAQRVTERMAQLLAPRSSAEPAI